MKIENLTIGYRRGKKEIVINSGIDAELSSGCFTCLLGPNGAGKTTLLRTMSGFIEPLNGQITIAGKNIKEISKLELSKLVGIVLTERVSLQNVTVEQLISLGRSPYTGFWGNETNNDKSIIDEALKSTGIDSIRHREVNTLSDGEFQKVMIAKALAQSTPTIILDEPTAFLDFPSKVEMMRLLVNLAHENNKNVLLSTHDLNMALTLADKIWLLDKNLGFIEGKTTELAEKGYFEIYFKAKGIRFDKKSLSFKIE